MPTRRATTTWTGSLEDGSGHITLDSSKLSEYDISFPSRASDTGGKQTDPEELIAAAHSGCLAMNMSGVLAGEGLTAESIDVKAAVSLGEDPAGGFRISGITLTMTASIPGVDDARFQELATKAEQTCPVSKALAGADISFTATLA